MKVNTAAMVDCTCRPRVILALFLAISVPHVYGQATPGAPPAPGPPNAPELARVLNALRKGGNFKTMISLLTSSGVNNTLAATNGQFTVLAPNDTAIAAAIRANPSLKQNATLTSTLLYHILPGYFGYVQLSRHAGQNLTTLGSSALVYITQLGRQVYVNDLAVNPKNLINDRYGAAHGLQGVLLPPAVGAAPRVLTRTAKNEVSLILSTLNLFGGYKTFVRLVRATGLDATLRAQINRGQLTVFAPSDKAFQQFNASGALANATTLATVLRYHLVPGFYPLANLLYYAGAPRIEQLTSLEGSTIDATTRVGLVYLNQASMFQPNIVVDRQVSVQGIDSVLVPPSVAPAPPPPSPPGPSEVNLISDALNRTNGNFTQFFAALESSGIAQALVDTVNMENITIFAPSNEAFSKYPAVAATGMPAGASASAPAPATGRRLLQTTGGNTSTTTAQQAMEDLLMYHIVVGYYPIAVLANQVAGTSLTSLQGGNLSISNAGSFVRVGNATVTYPNLAVTDKSSVQGIDYVLVPPGNGSAAGGAAGPAAAPGAAPSPPVSASTRALIATLAASKNYSQVAGLLQSSGVAANLSQSGPVTLFAPTNAAITKLEAQVPGIAQNTTLLQEILNYHIVSGAYSSSQLARTAGSSIYSVTGQPVNITKAGRQLYVNYGRVVSPDVKTGNPNVTVQGVDEIVLPPKYAYLLPAPAPAPGLAPGVAEATKVATTLRDFGNYSTSARLLAASGSNLTGQLASQPLTLFVPSDQAWAAFNRSHPGLSAANYTTIIQYHIATGFHPLADALYYGGAQQLTSLEGSPLNITTIGGQALVQNVTVRQANILADYQASVQGIDQVLIPPSLRGPGGIAPALAPAPAQAPLGAAEASLLVRTLRSNGNYTQLLSLLTSTGLGAQLARLQGVTVFAPSDQAFANFPGILGSGAEQDSSSSSKRRLLQAAAPTQAPGGSSGGAPTQAQLAEILRFHVVPQYFPVAELGSKAGDKLTTLEGNELALGTAGGYVTVGNATITSPNIVADGRSSVQGIDYVLVPDNVTLGGAGGAGGPSGAPSPSPGPASAPASAPVASPTGAAATAALLGGLAAAGGFRRLPQLLNTTGLNAVLANQSGPYTAFQQFNASGALANATTLATVLRYHLVAGTSLTSLQGGNLSISNAGSFVRVGNATVTYPNLAVTDKSSVQGIDYVLVPPGNGSAAGGAAGPAAAPGAAPSPPVSASTRALIATLAASKNYSQVAGLLQSSGVAANLSQSGPVTLFAPTNAAITKLEAQVPGIAQNTTLLQEILNYHIVSGAYSSSQLARTAGSSIYSVTGQPVNITKAGRQLYVNYGRVVSPDVKTGNPNVTVQGVDEIVLPPKYAYLLPAPAPAPGLAPGVAEATKVATTLRDFGNYSTSARLLAASGSNLTGQLASQPLTLFVPSDQAWAAFNRSHPGLSAANYTTIIQYHIATGFHPLADALYYGGAQQLTSLEGSPLNITTIGGQALVQNVTVRQANILADYQASVQGIDQVLIPPSLRGPGGIAPALAPAPAQAPLGAAEASLLVRTLRSNGNYTQLLSLLTSTGLGAQLARLQGVTVFAPSDQAFANFPGILGSGAEQDSSSSSKRRLLQAAAPTQAPGGSSGGAPTQAQLAEILRFHVVPQYFPVAELGSKAGDKLTTLEGNELALGTAGGYVTVGNATITSPNIVADGRSSVQGIDYVLVPDNAFAAFPNTLAREGGSNSKRRLLQTSDGGNPALASISNDTWTQILTYHVVLGYYPISDLATRDGKSLDTINGNEVDFSTDGGYVKVDNATIVAPNLLADGHSSVQGINYIMVPSNISFTTLAPPSQNGGSPGAGSPGGPKGASAAAGVPGVVALVVVALLSAVVVL
eukprot:jgi/Mesen1/6286/ME000324S05328